MDFTALKKTARWAGILYFFWILTAIYSLIYVQSNTFVKGDAAATAAKTLANEFIFRSNLVNGLFSSVLWILLVLYLYRLFKHVNKSQAVLMVVLVLVQIPVFFIMYALDLASLLLFKDALLKTFELPQRQDLAMFLLRINDFITIAIELFWGLWLFPFGYLVYKSGFIPKILGIFLILCGIAYVVHCFTHLLFPMYQALVFKISTPFWTLGEITIMLWLVFIGVKTKHKEELVEDKT